MNDKLVEEPVRGKRKRPQSNNSVSVDTLAFWKERFIWGDFVKIHDATGLSRPTIQRAFEGSATDEVINKITDYYLNVKRDEQKEKED